MSLRDDDVPFNLDREMKRFVAEETATLDSVLVQGRAKDFAHYKELCGQRAGLQRAHQHLLELIDNWNNRG